MKRLYGLLILNCLVINWLMAQDEAEKTNYYNLAIDASVIECDINGKTLTGVTNSQVPLNSLFTLIGETTTGDKIVRFWRWNPKRSTEVKFFKSFNAEEGNQDRYFLLSKADFEKKAIPWYSTRTAAFTFGAVIIPVKIRFSPFDFSKDFTLGTMAGAKWRISHRSSNYFSLLGGFGITSVSLDSASTSGSILKNTDRPAITPSIGAVLAFDDAQVGLFFGWDLISSKEPKWVYHGKTWFSLGLGYTIFSGQSKKKKNPFEKQEKIKEQDNVK
jgi:hypothetical protein